MPNPVVNFPDEVWKPVVGFEGFYEVSNMGRVRSVARRVLHKRAGSTRISPSRILRPALRAYGYLGLQLSVRGKQSSHYVHALVLRAFVGPRPDGTEACHCNGVATDNRACNLRWDTKSENNKDRFRHGYVAPVRRGEDAANAKLSNTKAQKIREMLASGMTQKQVAAVFGIGQSTVSRVKLRKVWN